MAQFTIDVPDEEIGEDWREAADKIGDALANVFDSVGIYHHDLPTKVYTLREIGVRVRGEPAKIDEFLFLREFAGEIVEKRRR